MALPDEISIGDFSRPVVSKPSSPTETSYRNIESAISDDLKKDEALLKPMLSYEEKLKEAGLTKEKAADIIDAVLLQGYYAEDIRITSKIKARFRSRTARDTKRAQDILEAQRLTFDHHYQETLTRILLAASLEQFGNDKLEHPPRKASHEVLEKAFQDRIAYVDNMSDPALRILFQKLYKFDKMIAAALEEGSIENF